MHTNHRRTNKCRTKCWPLAYSLRWYRRQASKYRRALERELISHERYDDLPTRYPRDIYYLYH